MNSQAELDHARSETCSSQEWPLVRLRRCPQSGRHPSEEQATTPIGTFTNGMEACDGVGAESSGNLYRSTISWQRRGQRLRAAVHRWPRDRVFTRKRPGGRREPSETVVWSSITDYTNARPGEYPPGTHRSRRGTFAVCREEPSASRLTLATSSGSCMNLTPSGSGVVYEYAIGCWLHWNERRHHTQLR